MYQEECKLLLINCAKRRENVTERVAIVEKIVKNRQVEHMEQKMHGTAEYVEQWNARKKKISVDFMKNRVHIAQKNENEIVKMLKMTKKYWNIVDIRRTAYYDTDMEQVPQYKVPKRKRCKCGTKSGW